MINKPTDAISFAWTANHETADYQHFPPYVNLTGNRLVLRGDERTEHGNKVTGHYVAVELPGEAIAELREALRSSAPVADDDALFSRALAVLERHYYTDADLARWLNAPHPQFDGKTAVEMLADGRKAEVAACVQRLDDAVYL